MSSRYSVGTAVYQEISTRVMDQTVYHTGPAYKTVAQVSEEEKDDLMVTKKL